MLRTNKQTDKQADRQASNVLPTPTDRVVVWVITPHCFLLAMFIAPKVSRDRRYSWQRERYIYRSVHMPSS